MPTRDEVQALTRTQILYLKSAAINPSGRTCIPGGTKTLPVLIEAGMVTHHGFGIVSITDTGRTKLSQMQEPTHAD